jgi:membrane protease YdiL (CAAX protease family)
MKIYPIIASVFFHSLILITFILGIVFFLKKRKFTKEYLKLALILTSIILSFNVLILLIVTFKGDSTFIVILGALVLPIAFLTLLIYISTGSFFSRSLGLPTTPLLKREKKFLKSKKTYLNILFSLFLIIVFSLTLFAFTHPTATADFEKTIRESLGLDVQFGFITFLLWLVLAAFIEEATFRLFIQNMLAYFLKKMRLGYLLAIIIVSVIWAFGHIGMVNPEWVKFTQIFGIGIILGFLMRKQGVESCIIVHAVLNLFSPLLKLLIEH